MNQGTKTKTYNKHQVYGILKDYHWMVKEIQTLQEELKETDFRGTQQWGVGATLPNGKGTVSKTLENEVIRRNLKSDRMNDYIDKVTFINNNMHKITGDKEKAVLDYLLDGWNVATISRRLEIHRNSIDKLKMNIIDRLLDEVD